MQYLRRGTVQEVFSTFASIAVWAAVRFVLKSNSSSNSNHQNRNMANSENHSGNFYAFLPLITDPGDEARNRYAGNFPFFSSPCNCALNFRKSAILEKSFKIYINRMAYGVV